MGCTRKKIAINPQLDRPQVVDFNNVDKNIFKETWGYIPDTPVNTYHYKRNLIILSSRAGADSLAHEYTHYFQFAYDAKGNIQNTGWDWNGIGPDQPELEAQRIQEKFRARDIWPT